jgi:hypothetical protein
MLGMDAEGFWFIQDYSNRRSLYSIEQRLDCWMRLRIRLGIYDERCKRSTINTTAEVRLNTVAIRGVVRMVVNGSVDRLVFPYGVWC